MYECARKEIFELDLHFRSKSELIEALAVRNPEWPQFADRLWGELRVRHDQAIAMLGTIEDGPLIRGTWVCEIGGVVKMYFALMDDEGIEEGSFARRWQRPMGRNRAGGVATSDTKRI